MSKARVQLYQKAGSITAEDGATKGAQFGRDVYSEDGTVLTLASLRTALQIPPPASGLSASAWSLLLDIPANVTALEEAVGTGLFAVTGAGVGAFRTLTPPAAGFAISNPGGVAGNPTFTLSDDLAALEALGSTGIAVRTASNTWAQRQVATADGSRITVVNPRGVAGDITLDLATVADAGGGSLLKVARDGYGRLTGTSAVATGDLTPLLDSTYQALANPVQLLAYTLATLPAVTPSWRLIVVSDLTGGAEPCFSDGTNWRRCSDRSIAS